MNELGRLADGFQTALKNYVHGAENRDPDISITARLDMDFHGLLVRSTRNEYLLSMYEAIGKTVEYLSIRTNQFLVSERNPDNLLLLGSQHVAIYRAVKFGFPELARSAMDKHIDSVRIPACRTGTLERADFSFNYTICTY